jgi:uncharacterized delta-60 repeat protein
MRNSKIYRVISTPVLAFLALLIVGATNIKAAPGDLDSTFGNGGIVVTSITNAPYYDFPRSIQVQPDGKIVVCGEIRVDDSDQNSSAVSFFLARFHPNGTLDNSFGTNGKIVASINSGDELVAEEIALQPDGKIIAVGYKDFNFAVNRYNSDGTLDASFGTGGKVVTQVGNLYSAANSVTVQPDGKIVVVGSGSLDPYTDGFAVVRYNPNGSLDPSFGAGGKIITPFSNNYADAFAVMLQPDGKIVVAGISSNGGFSRYDFTLARYNADGSLDSGFGAGGKVVHTFPNAEAYLTDAVLQPDGRIVVIGHLLSANPPATVIVRYNANGSIDTGFAENGIFTSRNTFFSEGGIALQPDGKIVSFGQVYFAVSAALRLNPNGSPDTGFGSNGVAITNFGSSYGLAGAIQPNGRILLLGYSWTGGDIAIFRFLGDATACPNSIDCNEFFVRQQYRDFLNRDPDTPGLAHWAGEITACDDPARRQPGESLALCIERTRTNTSAAFFLSPEFQYTGYFVYRLYKGSLTQNGAGRFPTYQQFLRDFGQVRNGIIQDNQLSAAVIEENKKKFAEEFTRRPEFRSLYDPLSNFDYVERLFQTTGINASATEKQALVQSLDNQTETRASVLQKVVDGTVVIAEGNQQFTTAYGRAFYEKEFNAAFVLMEYFGYLHRDPDAAGYQHWLDKLNLYGNYIDAEMVKSFITSPEYRARFGQP